jgi:hypothetical protein
VLRNSSRNSCSETPPGSFPGVLHRRAVSMVCLTVKVGKCSSSARSREFALVDGYG